MNKIKSIIEKLNIDKKTLIALSVGIVVIFLIFISEQNFSNDNEEKVNEKLSNVEYCEYLENKLQDMVECIDGAGQTKVMITLSETTEYVYATNDKTARKPVDENTDVNTQKDYVIIDSNSDDSGLLIKTIEPKVRGVAVVCEGGNNPQVQEQIISLVSAVLNISTSRISISKFIVLEE